MSGGERVALPVRAARAGRRAGRLAGGPDRHRGGRAALRRAGPAVGTQRGGRGRGHRHPRPLRRAGHGARGGAHGRRMAPRDRVLGHAPGGVRRCRAGRRMARAARPAPPARRVARHGRGARPRRAHAHGGTLPARRQLRPAGAGRAGPPGRCLGVGPVLAGPRGLAGAPGAVDRRLLPRRRPGGAVVSRRRGRPGRGVRVHRVLRGAADRHGLAHLRPRRRPRRPGAADEVGRGRLRRPGPRGRVARAPARRTPRWRWNPCSPRTTWPASCCAPTSRRARPAGRPTVRPRPGPVADGDGGELVRGAGRRHGPRHVLGGGVAADGGAQRLPGAAAPGLGPLDPRRW